jgi:hypothetical protein
VETGRATCRLLVAVAGIAAAGAGAARADDLEIAWDPELAQPHDRDGYARLLQEVVRTSYAQVSAELGLRLRRPLKVRVHTRAGFEREFGTEAAFVEAALYTREAIHVNGGSRLDDRFAGLVVHEMAHAVFDHRDTAGSLPMWLNEGLAERLSWKRRGLGELAPNQVAELKQARARGALTPLPVSGDMTRFGYLQCYAAVLFLERKVGRAELLAVVRRTLDGEPFDRLLARELGLSVPELERDLLAWVGRLP